MYDIPKSEEQLREEQWNEERIARHEEELERQAKRKAYLESETPKTPEIFVGDDSITSLSNEELAEQQRHNDPRALLERLKRSGH